MSCNAMGGYVGAFVGVPFWLSVPIALATSGYLFYKMNHPYSIIPYFAAIICFQGTMFASMMAIYGTGFLVISGLEKFNPAKKNKKSDQ